jgi:8-oxo-dGTP pyrophosphatase MutT (NUDIX family)
MDPFARHIAACNNLPSPAGYLPLRIGEDRVGWLEPEAARALTFLPKSVHFGPEGVSLAAGVRGVAARSAALAEIARTLARSGFGRIRGEEFDVRAHPAGPVLATVDRGVLPALGIMSQGVHMNGLVRRADGLHLWVGWRAKDKSVAPGQMDNVVAGGIPAGLTPERCLAKEAEEEASLPAELALKARPVGQVSYIMRTEEGMRRDLLHLYDLDMPEDVIPRPNDDEVERFELWPIGQVLEAVRDTERVKFNVNLVLLDLFLREGLVQDPDGSLRAGLDQLA